MNSQKLCGQCRLTGEIGPYVKSHLIPRALTRLEGTGAKFVETGIGLGTKSRSNSWYDQGLVTRNGEDILAEIDAVGIHILREHRLVWSGWGASSLAEEGLTDVDPSGNFRVLWIDSPEKLQLFFLSLLWRAGATGLEEFKDVTLSADVLSDLADRILQRDPGNFMDYPVQLFQLSTKGYQHNRTPLMERKVTVGLDNSQGPEVNYVRFYFDGFVVHILLPGGIELPTGYDSSCLNHAEKTIIFLNCFEESRAWRDMKEMIITVEQERALVPGKPTPLIQALVQAWPLGGCGDGFSSLQSCSRIAGSSRIAAKE